MSPRPGSISHYLSIPSRQIAVDRAPSLEEPLSAAAPPRGRGRGAFMSDWNFDTDFRLWVKQPFGKVFQLTTLHSVDATLVTNAGVNQMRAILYDPGQRLRNLTEAQGRLHPMQAIQLWLNNRYQQWGKAWTGYIDSVHYLFDPAQGDLCQIMCTGPIKLWEITNTTPQSAYDLSFAYQLNVASSRVLRYSCDAVGYPQSNLIVDPVVDTGSGLQDAVQNVTSNPQAQQWSSIIQALQGNAGIEWFFNEEGRSEWRQVGYLRVPPHGYRPVLDEDVLSSDLAEGDDGVVTKVSVRFDVRGNYQAGINNAPGEGNVIAEAPASMIAHLRQREVVEYIPWLRQGADGVPTATFLANFLLQQYAANVITGSITIPADPMFRVGTVCQVPSLRGDGSQMLFYISSIAYALQWNGHWTMTLGLTYGRPLGGTFPYGQAATYPTWTREDAAAYATNSPSPDALVSRALPTEPTNSHKIVTAFKIRQVAGTPKGQALVDPGYLPAGATITLALADGTPVGAQGYTVARGPTATQPTIQVAPARGLPASVYVTVVSASTAVDSNTALPGAPSTTPAPTRTTIPGTAAGLPAAPASAPTKVPPSSFAGQVFAFALTRADPPGSNTYLGGHAGPTYTDCAGLVSYAFAVKGMDRLLAGPPFGNGDSRDKGPEGIWNFFADAHGGRVLRDITLAQPGDLMFVHSDAAESGGIQQGYLHVCFNYGPGQIYGANHDAQSGSPGIYICNISGFSSGWGYVKGVGNVDGPINQAISMAGVTLASCQG